MLQIVNYFSGLFEKWTIVITLLALLTFSCDRNSPDKCPGVEIETIPIEGLESLRFQNIDEDKKEVNLFIRSKMEYDKYVTAPDKRPEIDFSKYALLCGRIKYNWCHSLQEKQVVDRCGIIEHQIYVAEQLCAALTTVYYFTVIPAKYVQKTEIKFVEIPYN